MRDSIIDLFKNTLILEYRLPNKVISRSCVSTQDDFAFKNLNDECLSKLIYNGIVDLAFEDYNIDITKLNEIQKNALNYKIKYSDDYNETAKLKLGFYGEVLLNLFLQIAFGTDVFVVRGQFFDILNSSEACGYDCHHILDRKGNLELWFGETKFYISFKSALNKIWENASKAISLSYLNRNFQSIIQTNKTISTTNKVILDFINSCKQNPYRNFYEDIIKYDFHLVYPILLICDVKNNDFDGTIKECIDHIQFLQQKCPLDDKNEIPKTLFFLFLPVSSTKIIKMEVLKCIQMNTPLI